MNMRVELSPLIFGWMNMDRQAVTVNFLLYLVG
jgi:hypothetical protein